MASLSPVLSSVARIVPTVAGLFLWTAVLLLPQPDALPESGHVDWLARASSYLRGHADELAVEPDKADPFFECLGRDGDTVTLLYRQDLEMARGTLVARYRATVTFAADGEVEHERWFGGLPEDWELVDEREGRRAWRESELSR